MNSIFVDSFIKGLVPESLFDYALSTIISS